ncbi:STAS domain-containing protein [Dactylosporangium sp. NPDC051485]|uniref:STAS domain-containing protein n=1 Tax=Dactylosporangium sp. NPDC051485 TaxID=3154846 RepID=UPI00341A8704
MTVMTIPAQATGGVPRVAVAGDVDVSTAPALRAALEHATTGHPASIEVDVAGVTHFSLAGLRVLDDVRRGFGGTLVLLDAGRPVRRILEVLGLHDRFSRSGARPR